MAIVRSAVMERFSWFDQLTRRCIGRPVSHLTPRYLLDRCRLWVYQRRSPNAPWLTADAIAILNTALRKTDNGLEYGSGSSTIWLSHRTNRLISIEHSPVWHRRVCETIEREELKDVVCKYIPANKEPPDDPYRASYVEGDAGIAPGSLDYVLIDGLYRGECALRAVDLLKPGGLLILDNANRYIPHNTRSPLSAATPPSPLWSELLSRVADWRLIWTSNGVFDTALWFKAS